MNTFHYTGSSSSSAGRRSGLSGSLAALGAGAVLNLAAGCAPGTDAGGPPFAVDILPPVILDAEVLDERRIRFTFDEPATGELEQSRIEPELPLTALRPVGNTIVAEFSRDQKIGVNYVMRCLIRDKSGNSLSFLYNFSGWNPSVPRILINELNPEGSGRKPDCVELLLISDGNLGGLVFSIGTEEHPKGELVFPSIKVSSGDFIVIHTKPEGIPEEVNETGPIDVSGGLLAYDTARDFWMSGSPGLPGNNGAVTLYSRRGGSILDAVIWSNRSDDPGDEKRGWTRESFKWAAALASGGGWRSKDTVVLPSEAVKGEPSSATRSICRNTRLVDTDTKNDWHIVPNGGQTFGSANSDKVYVP